MRPTLHIKKHLRKFGYDIIKFRPDKHPVAQRKALLAAYGIDLVLDVGANDGDFADELRSFGYRGRIVSFEPIHSTFLRLQNKAWNDANWTALHLALGEIDGEREMHVAQNTLSSSLLEMLDTHAVSDPDSKYIGKETIQLRRLDSVFGELHGDARNIFLKLDTQGYERHVLEGAADSLAHIDTLQVEVSLVPLYEGGFLFEDMQTLLSEKGYRLVGVETVFTHPGHGETLQLDAIFHRDALRQPGL